MPTNFDFYPIPYRDTDKRLQVVKDTITGIVKTYTELIAPNYAVRPLFFNDFIAAGASSSVVTSTGIVLSSVTASNTTFNYGASASITFTVPVNKVYQFYGFADYSANPVARVVQITIAGTTYNPIYLLPYIATDEDKEFVLKQPFRSIPPNTQATITIYGTAAGTELFDVLGFVAETPPSVSP